MFPVVADGNYKLLQKHSKQGKQGFVLMYFIVFYYVLKVFEKGTGRTFFKKVLPVIEDISGRICR